MIRRLALLGLLLAGRVAAAQSPVVRVDDAGPGVGPRVLVEALSHPYTVAPEGSGSYLIARRSDNSRSVVVLGRDVVVEGHVTGDVIVIGGDLYMHPGAMIEGRALSFGGGVYESSLATIRDGVRVFKDFTYDITPAASGSYALRYHPTIEAPKAGLSFPGVFGVEAPEYDRSDGLAIGFAPRYSVPDVPLIVAPKISYHSQIGQWDPSLELEYNFDRLTRFRVRGERATLSNDRWIRADLLNSVDFLWSGNDVRNYYRATFADARLDKTWETLHGEISPYIGARVEDATSVRPGIDASGGPWVFIGRDDEDRDDRLRFNPPITEGKTYSGLVGGAWRWSNEGFVVRLRLAGEVGHFDPNPVTCPGFCAPPVSETFGQATIQGHLEFPTFSQELLALDGHFVATTIGATPHQRYAYFGGPGTIPMLDILSEGGDELFYVDSRYVIPMHWFNLPFFGAPALTLRELLGGAAVQSFPHLHQAVGARLGLKMLYGEFLIDPDTHKKSGGVGVSLTP
ncbi:MAG TPA: hypothetical protein VGM82_15595 [Gemmatimonadaceae bacterium]